LDAESLLTDFIRPALTAAPATSIATAFQAFATCRAAGTFDGEDPVRVSVQGHDVFGAAVVARVKYFVSGKPATCAALLIAFGPDLFAFDAEKEFIICAAAHLGHIKAAEVCLANAVEADLGAVAQAVSGTGAAVFQCFRVAQTVSALGQFVASATVGHAQFGTSGIPVEFAAEIIRGADASLAGTAVAAGLVGW